VTVAVIAHSGKTLGGGLAELRYALAREGIVDPIWHEVPKSKAAPKRVRHALAAGADVIVAWGGDGMMQRCIDVLAGTEATLVIVPAGTANLLARNARHSRRHRAGRRHRLSRSAPPDRRRPWSTARRSPS
jgi:diacylglycerol kinase family enzyme